MRHLRKRTAAPHPACSRSVGDAAPSRFGPASVPQLVACWCRVRSRVIVRAVRRWRGAAVHLSRQQIAPVVAQQTHQSRFAWRHNPRQSRPPARQGVQPLLHRSSRLVRQSKSLRVSSRLPARLCLAAKAGAEAVVCPVQAKPMREKWLIAVARLTGFHIAVMLRGLYWCLT